MWYDSVDTESGMGQGGEQDMGYARVSTGSRVECRKWNETMLVLQVN